MERDGKSQEQPKPKTHLRLDIFSVPRTVPFGPFAIGDMIQENNRINKVAQDQQRKQVWDLILALISLRYWVDTIHYKL